MDAPRQWRPIAPGEEGVDVLSDDDADEALCLDGGCLSLDRIDKLIVVPKRQKAEKATKSIDYVWLTGFGGRHCTVLGEGTVQ